MEGYHLLQGRLDALKGSPDPAGADINLEENVPNALKNKYKNREVEGNLLHYAIDLDSDIFEETGAEPNNVRLVLEAGARVDSWMVFNAFGQEGRVTPIHLAATRGLIPAIRLLVEFEADVNQKSLHADELHFCPIHDAAFSQNFEAVECLLELWADPNVTNKDGKSCLHLCAQTGAAAVAELLVEKRARLDQGLPGQSEDRSMPMSLAVKQRMFPKEQLHVLAPFCYEGYEEVNFFESMLQICRESTPYAKALIASILGENPAVNTEQRSRVVKAVKDAQEGRKPGFSPIPRLTEIIKLSPEVGAAILDIFLLTPKAAAPFHWPLPRVANIAQEPLHTTYSPDIEWKFDTSQTIVEQQMPPWHHSLAPKPESNEDDREVQVKYLSFPNVLDIRVLHGLNTAQNKNIFSAMTIQAIVRCSWMMVRNVVILNICCECIAIFILAWWSCITLELLPITLVIDPEQCLLHPYSGPLNGSLANGSLHNHSGEGIHSKRGLHDESDWVVLHHKMVMTAMCVLWALAMREAFNFCYYVTMHRSWQFHWRLLFNINNMMEVTATSVMILFLLLFSVRGGSDVPGFLFCANTLTRAVKLLMRLSGQEGIGEQILPIVSSLRPMSRFFFMASVMYFTFLIAFASLRSRGKDMYDVSEGLFFSMWAADGNSFGGLRNLDNGGDLTLALLMMAIVCFTVCMLNLMIAIFSQVYREKQADYYLLFLQHRCLMIEQCLLRPVWRFECSGLIRPGCFLYDFMLKISGACSGTSAVHVGEDDNDHHHDHHDNGQDIEEAPPSLLPYVLSGLFFALWLVLGVVTEPGCSGILLAVLLSVALVLLQSALMQNMWFNRDYYIHRRLLAEAEHVGETAGAENGAVLNLLQGSSREMQIQMPDMPSAANLYNRAFATDMDGDYEEDYFIWICHSEPFVTPAAKDNSHWEKMKQLARTVDKLSSNLADVDEKLSRLHFRLDEALPQTGDRMKIVRPKRLSGNRSKKSPEEKQNTFFLSGQQSGIQRYDSSMPARVESLASYETVSTGKFGTDSTGTEYPQTPPQSSLQSHHRYDEGELGPHSSPNTWTGRLPLLPPRLNKGLRNEGAQAHEYAVVGGQRRAESMPAPKGDGRQGKKRP